MRRLALSTLSLAFVAAGVGAQNPPIAKRRVAVLDFDYSTVQGDVAAVMGTNQDIGKGIADMIVTQLVKNGTYSVIERKKMDQIMAEQNFQQSGRTDPSTAVQLAKILGVDAVIMGSITQFGRDDHNVGVSAGGLKVGGFGLGSVGTKSAKAVVAIDARIVSTTTAEILDVAKGKGESSRSGLSLGAAGGGNSGAAGGAFTMGSSNFGATLIGEATNNAVDSLTMQLVGAAAKIPESVVMLQALVADVDGSTITINVGTSSGVRVGGTYPVLHAGKEIHDPATGKVIKRQTTNVGSITITEADEGSATGKFSGTGPAKVGDCVGACPAHMAGSPN